MQTNARIKAVAGAVVLALAVSGCATVGADGKEHADMGKSTALGAGIGAVAGYLAGGARGMAIGAALGAGAGYLAGLENAKKELADAKASAVELSRDTQGMMQPVVFSQTYQDDKGERAEGLKSVDVRLPLHDMFDKHGALTAKGAAAMTKLQAVADRTGSLELVVSKKLPASTFLALTQAVPRAKIVVSDSAGATARIVGKPVDAGSGIRPVSV
jgi:hypothetical protein